jgi:hypothetical protein
MEGHCSTGQSPQRAVVPVEEEEDEEEEEEDDEEEEEEDNSLPILWCLTVDLRLNELDKCPLLHLHDRFPVRQFWQNILQYVCHGG